MKETLYGVLTVKCTQKCFYQNIVNIYNWVLKQTHFHSAGNNMSKNWTTTHKEKTYDRISTNCVLYNLILIVNLLNHFIIYILGSKSLILKIKWNVSHATLQRYSKWQVTASKGSTINVQYVRHVLFQNNFKWQTFLNQ